MNSLERHELRYQRRKAKRLANKLARVKAVGNLDEVFQYHKVWKYGKECCNNIRWKPSTQNFERHLFSTTAVNCYKVKNHKWKPGGHHTFDLIERGHPRHIEAPSIQDRQVEKVLTKSVLLPLYSPHIIRANTASQPGKGLHFNFRIIKNQLQKFYRKHGNDGYAVCIDIKQFFPNADRKVIYTQHDKYLCDPDFIRLADSVTYLSPSTDKLHLIGAPLGVEPSQMEMVEYPSPIDNYMKCQVGVKFYSHFADDFLLLAPSKQIAKDLLEKFIVTAKQLGLVVNRSKTVIKKLSKGFKFCKCTFRLMNSGKVLTRGNRDAVKRFKSRFKYFFKQLKAGLMTYKYIKDQYRSQISYFKNYNDHNRILKLNRFYYNLYIDYRRSQVCTN